MQKRLKFFNCNNYWLHSTTGRFACEELLNINNFLTSENSEMTDSPQFDELLTEKRPQIDGQNYRSGGFVARTCSLARARI